RRPHHHGVGIPDRRARPDHPPDRRLGVIAVGGDPGRNRDHHDPFAAPPDRGPDAGGLSAPEPAGHPDPGQLHRYGADPRARRDRGDIARRRRDRNHEHHAGHRHG